MDNERTPFIKYKMGYFTKTPINTFYSDLYYSKSGFKFVNYMLKYFEVSLH